MANTKNGNVVRVDTSAAFTDIRRVKSVKYMGAASGAADIRADGSASGTLLWAESGTANVYDPEVDIYNSQGIYVTIASGAVVYLYLG